MAEAHIIAPVVNDDRGRRMHTAVEYDCCLTAVNRAPDEASFHGGGLMMVRFAAVGLFVGDIAKMVEFYRDVIGIEIEWDGSDPQAEFKHDGIRFMMYSRAELPGYLGCAVSYPNGLNGTFELAIDFPRFSDVDRQFERVVSMGARPVFSPRNESWGMRVSFVADPEGNLIEIFSSGREKTDPG